jgi:hypothetical protein
LVTLRQICRIETPEGKTVNIYLRTLSDNAPHPEAVGPILHFSNSPSYLTGRPFGIRVIGNLIGIVLQDVEGIRRIEIWDWKTFQKVTVRTGIRDLSFDFTAHHHPASLGIGEFG